MKTKAEQRTIHFGSKRIDYNLYKGTRKNLRIVVSPEMMIDVKAPDNVGDREIENALRKKVPWLNKTLNKIQSYHPLPTPKQYISGETIVYLGRQYRLKIDKGESPEAKLVGRFLRVFIDELDSKEKVRQIVDLWYRARSQIIFGRYMKACYSVASRHGVPEPTLTIRKMKRRWGSCSASGRITLNLDLIGVPVHCIEYVIMHELSHLVHHNHSREYFALLTRCLPDWRQRKNTLDKFRIT